MLADVFLWDYWQVRSSRSKNGQKNGLLIKAQTGSIKRYLDVVTAGKVTAMAGSDVVQSGRPIFDEFSNICGRISAITQRMLPSKWSSVCGLSA
ncbi:hypothetical protein TNCV_2994881 [Trichonephila clavipes]|nr:hypothetical protein TNCV_2994881 [Trichonephila clavipes]